MVKKNINQDRDNAIAGELLTRKDQEDDLNKVLQLEKPIVDATGNPPAKSMWSTGRGCPRCKRTLRIKEMSEDTGHLKVFCLCGGEWWAEDLELTGSINDKLHRQIPDDLVLRYMSARDKSLRRQGK